MSDLFKKAQRIRNERDCRLCCWYKTKRQRRKKARLFLKRAEAVIL